MGFLNFRTDPEAVKNEREARVKEAEKRRGVPAPKEFEQIKLIQEQEKLQDLKDFDFIDGEIGVNFGFGFNDSKTYYSAKDLEK